MVYIMQVHPVAFFTPIVWDSNNHSFATKVDKYFQIIQNSAIVNSLPTNKRKYTFIRNETSQQSNAITALKIASYCTLIIPLIMLILKAIIRSYYTQEQAPTIPAVAQPKPAEQPYANIPTIPTTTNPSNHPTDDINDTTLTSEDYFNQLQIDQYTISQIPMDTKIDWMKKGNKWITLIENKKATLHDIPEQQFNTHQCIRFANILSFYEKGIIKTLDSIPSYIFSTFTDTAQKQITNIFSDPDSQIQKALQWLDDLIDNSAPTIRWDNHDIVGHMNTLYTNCLFKKLCDLIIKYSDIFNEIKNNNNKMSEMITDHCYKSCKSGEKTFDQIPENIKNEWRVSLWLDLCVNNRIQLTQIPDNIKNKLPQNDISRLSQDKIN